MTPATHPAPEVASLVALAEQVARQAGTLIRGERPARVEVASTKSSPTDVVTAMDQAAERLLRRELGQARPDDRLLGEEAGYQGGNAGPDGLTWVIDPIDGTVNYLYGIPVYAVSVAVVLGDPRVAGGWRPIAGCVHNPASGETWTAGAGLGAFLDGARLTMPTPPRLDGALIGTGFGYRSEQRRAQARVVAELLPRVRDVRRIGSAAIDLCSVASGRFDAYYETGLNPWDLAAGMLVVTESGGVVAGLRQRPPHARMVVAGADPLLQDLVAELERLDADREG